MTPDGSRTHFTTLETRNAAAHTWSEEQKHSYLLTINARENPTALERLEGLFAEGHTAEQVAQLCNEKGHLVYANWDDPNALINRYEFFDPDDIEEHPPLYTQSMILDASFYFPSVSAIQTTRDLIEHTLENEKLLKGKQKLVTEEDYRNLFTSFHPDTLKELIKNLRAIEITQGCNGPCRKQCFLDPETIAIHHMPYNIVIWLIDEYKRLMPDHRLPAFYYASDLSDYRDGDKTAADIFAYVMEKYQEHKYLSVAWSLRPATIEFLYQAVIVKNLSVSRISQLHPKNMPNAANRLLEKIAERAHKDGRRMERRHFATIANAMNEGSKLHLNHSAGKNGTRNKEEYEMATQSYACFHGTILRAGKGFKGVILRPTTKVFPQQHQEFPITPHGNTVTIPIVFWQSSIFAPLRSGSESITMLRPRHITINHDGEVALHEQETAGERRIRRISELKVITKRIYYELRYLERNKTITTQSRVAFIEQQNATIQERLQITLDMLCNLRNNVQKLLATAKELYEEYRDDELAIFEIANTLESYINEIWEGLSDLHGVAKRVSKKGQEEKERLTNQKAVLAEEPSDRSIIGNLQTFMIDMQLEDLEKAEKLMPTIGEVSANAAEVFSELIDFMDMIENSHPTLPNLIERIQARIKNIDKSH